MYEEALYYFRHEHDEDDTFLYVLDEMREMREKSAWDDIDEEALLEEWDMKKS